MSSKKVEYLVVDTTAFIQNAPLQDIADNIITCNDVVYEIKSKRQLRRLAVLPYNLEVKTVFPENVKIITEFAKKTGDLPSLSSTDIRVMALTYQLEKEKVGTDHLRTTPIMQKSVKLVKKPTILEVNSDTAGFFAGKTMKEKDSVKENSVDNDDDEEYVDACENLDLTNLTIEDPDENLFEECQQDPPACLNDNQTSLENNIENEETNEIGDTKLTTVHIDIVEKAIDGEGEDFEIKSSELNNGNIADNHSEEKGIQNEAEEEFSEDDENEFSEQDEDIDEEDDEDAGGWITPSNLKEKQKQIKDDSLEDKHVVVGCMTTDFAMQNVLKQMNLNVCALDGRVIKHLRTFILRCYSCFKTTGIMTKQFCPNCGNNTLKKVAVSLDENGQLQIHINIRRPLTGRGKKFSLPTFKGGKHPNNPILVEDQRIPQNRPTRIARTKINPLEHDYIAGYSPFAMRDVYSKSAQLGIRPGQEFKYWMKKNPNESCRRRRKK